MFRIIVIALIAWTASSFHVLTANAQTTDEDARTRIVLGVEWRALALAGHLGHGPGAHVGVALLNEHLTIGLVAFGRPGPINPATFEVTPANGQTYKGKDTLHLRSDGAFVGLYVQPAFRVGKRVHVELPISVGQAAFGFYLTGDDRKTPDGRRVREWEDELLDGRDASVALGVEGGLRVAVEVTPWFRPYAAIHYMQTFGFDTYVKSSYSGASMALGVQLSSPVGRR